VLAPQVSSLLNYCFIFCNLIFITGIHYNRYHGESGRTYKGGRGITDHGEVC
jgi:hypothetical protein